MDAKWSHLVISFALRQGAPSCWKMHRLSPNHCWMAGRRLSLRAYLAWSILNKHKHPNVSWALITEKAGIGWHHLGLWYIYIYILKSLFNSFPALYFIYHLATSLDWLLATFFSFLSGLCAADAFSCCLFLGLSTFSFVFNNWKRCSIALKSCEWLGLHKLFGLLLQYAFIVQC